MTSTGKFLASAATLALISLAPLAARATTVTLDNGPSSGSISTFGVPDSQTYGEVFTAPVTGTMTSFTLSLNGGVGDLYGGVGAWNGTSTFAFGDGESSNLYTSANVPSTGAASYTFSPNISVIAGNTYVAYLSVFGDSGATTGTSMPTSTNGVTGIDYFVWNNSNGGAASSSWNYSFNIQDYSLGNAQFAATFVSGGVPEPTSWALMLMGFGGLGAALRSNRRRQPSTIAA